MSKWREKHVEKKRRKRKSRPWHRMLGVLTALPLVWVLLTGVVLNHSEDWGLDDCEVTHPWVLAAYGMTPEGEPVGLEVNGRLVVDWDGLVFFDGNAIDVGGKLVGAVRDGNGVAVVSDFGVIRFDAEGEVLEKLDEISLPAFPLTGVGVDGQRVVLRNGEGWFLVGDDWLEVERIEGDFEAIDLGAMEADDGLRGKWSRGGLPMSRVVLDLHAGNFLGRAGAYFYDFVALCTMVLIGSGLVLFFRKPQRRKGDGKG